MTTLRRPREYDKHSQEKVAPIRTMKLPTTFVLNYYIEVVPIIQVVTISSVIFNTLITIKCLLFKINNNSSRLVSPTLDWLSSRISDQHFATNI